MFPTWVRRRMECEGVVCPIHYLPKRIVNHEFEKVYVTVSEPWGPIFGPSRTVFSSFFGLEIDVTIKRRILWYRARGERPCRYFLFCSSFGHFWTWKGERERFPEAGRFSRNQNWGRSSNSACSLAWKRKPLPLAWWFWEHQNWGSNTGLIRRESERFSGVRWFWKDQN